MPQRVGWVEWRRVALCNIDECEQRGTSNKLLASIQESYCTCPRVACCKSCEALGSGDRVGATDRLTAEEFRREPCGIYHYLMIFSPLFVFSYSFVSRSPSATTSSITSTFRPGHFFLPQTNHDTMAKIQTTALIGKAYCALVSARHSPLGCTRMKLICLRTYVHGRRIDRQVAREDHPYAHPGGVDDGEEVYGQSKLAEGPGCLQGVSNP